MTASPVKPAASERKVPGSGTCDHSCSAVKREAMPFRRPGVELQNHEETGLRRELFDSALRRFRRLKGLHHRQNEETSRQAQTPNREHGGIISAPRGSAKFVEHLCEDAACDAVMARLDQRRSHGSHAMPCHWSDQSRWIRGAAGSHAEPRSGRPSGCQVATTSRAFKTISSVWEAVGTSSWCATSFRSLKISRE